MKKSYGFTLSEIMIVVIILSVLAGMAVPRFLTAAEQNRSSEGVQLLTALLQAQRRFALENNGAYTDNLANLDMDVNLPATSNFENLTISAAAASLASIQRKGNLYTLTINENGAINCSADTDSWCSKLGL